MKWQQHSRISVLAGNGSAALSDFEQDPRAEESGAAVRLCSGVAVAPK